VAIDTNTAGNSVGACSAEGCAPGTLGNIDTCAAISVGGTVDIDIVVNAVPNVVAASGAGPNLSGFDMDLHYDPAVVTVTAKTTAPSILYAGSGSVPFSGTEGVPSSDGDFSIGEVDNGPIGESGAGVLIRLTLTGAGVGSTTLHLDYVLGGNTPPNLYDHSGSQNIYTIGTVQDAQIVVGGSCPASAGGATTFAALSSRTATFNV
jgi:hypothetical protein